MEACHTGHVSLGHKGLLILLGGDSSLLTLRMKRVAKDTERAACAHDICFPCSQLRECSSCGSWLKSQTPKFHPWTCSLLHLEQSREWAFYQVSQAILILGPMSLQPRNKDLNETEFGMDWCSWVVPRGDGGIEWALTFITKKTRYPNWGPSTFQKQNTIFRVWVPRSGGKDMSCICLWS